MIGCVDLFCGVGGLTHGLIQGGIDVRAGIDLDPECRYPYEENNSSKFLERDVSALTGDELKKLWGNRGRSLLAGCAPCQPFSTYSRKGRKKRDDDKWSLVAHFGRLIEESEPDFVTMENVPQVLDHRVFQEFVTTLADYYVWHDVIECSEYEIPQTRKRLVLLASKHAPVSLLPANPKRPRASVKNSIGHLPALRAGECSTRDNLHRACRLSEINLRRIKASVPGGTWRDWPKSLVAKCHQRETGDTYPSVYGRMEWDKPAPTMTTQCFGYGNGRFGHPSQDRAITLREAAILQTFPDCYKLVPENETVRFSTLGRLIGNAVPVRLGLVIAKSFVAHCKELTKQRSRGR